MAQKRMMLVLKYRYLVPLASYFPDRMLRWLHRKLPWGYDPADGWTIWMDASYARYVRHDMRR
jgi:hypothetical protein